MINVLTVVRRSLHTRNGGKSVLGQLPQSDGAAKTTLTGQLYDRLDSIFSRVSGIDLLHLALSRPGVGIS